MAAHLLTQTLPLESQRLAHYYQRAAGLTGEPVAEVREDLDWRLTECLGIKPRQLLTLNELANVLGGNRADGKPILGKQYRRSSVSIAEEAGLPRNRLPTTSELGQVLRGFRADTGSRLSDESAVALRGRILKLYGVTAKKGEMPTALQLSNIFAGRRADGKALREIEVLDGLTSTRPQISFVDFCWAADKSVSLAWAFAPTEGEANVIAGAHRRAVELTMHYVEAEIGKRRKGKGGSGGYELGKIGWIRCDHYTSRPTTEFVSTDESTGEKLTRTSELNVIGAPHLHTHVCVPSVVVSKNRSSEGARAGSLDLRQLSGRVHEFGHVYQAFLATNLRRVGIDVELDESTGAARITSIPNAAREEFSKRTRLGELAARDYAFANGLVWEALSDSQKVKLMKAGVQGDPRQAKTDDVAEWVAWRKQAAAIGWSHSTVVRKKSEHLDEDENARIEKAYNVALRILEKKLQRCAVLKEAELRAAAANGLTASGIAQFGDIETVVTLFYERGVLQDGEITMLHRGLGKSSQGLECVQVTTQMHADLEKELIGLAKDAIADRSDALSLNEIENGLKRSGISFSGSHGGRQRVILECLGQGGRLAVAIGVAGSGKSTLLRPLTLSWGASRQVWGVSLAWRQSQDLVDAGIPEERCLALSALISRAKSGEIVLSDKSVVVLDELSLVSTRMLLELLRLRAKYNFSIVGVGDPLQCQSVEAGPTMDLLKRAVGPNLIPEIVTTVRQETERERTTSLLFRQARAAEALELKREDGSARLISGDYDSVVSAIADLWKSRVLENQSDNSYSVTVSAPSNADARAISTAIRERRRQLGQIGEDLVEVSACDSAGQEFLLKLAIGDRLRLFSRINASCDDRSRGIIGNNGSVVEVIAISNNGLRLRNKHGREGVVSWDTLRDPQSQRIRLTYGDVMSIDSSQGLTSSEHIQAYPNGSSAVDAFKVYTASSRHRRTTFVVVSEGAERREIVARRPLGDTRIIRSVDIWDNVARNFSRQGSRESALAFMERTEVVKRDTTEIFQKCLRDVEDGLYKGRPQSLLRRSKRTSTRGQLLQFISAVEALISSVAESLATLEQIISARHVVRAKTMLRNEELSYKRSFGLRRVPRP